MRSKEYNWIDESENKDSIEFLKYSIELAHAGRLEEAVEEIRRQISHQPNVHFLHYWLGILLFDLEDYAEACEAFKKELEITPRFRDAAWELGSAYSRLELTEETIKAYQQALDIDPCCVQALYGLGNAKMRSGEYSEAIEYYEDALFIQPELDRSDPRSSDERSKSLVAIIHHNLGVMWMLLRNLEKAQESFRRCQEIAPSGPLYELANDNLKLLSDVIDKSDSITWNMIEFPPEDI